MDAMFGELALAKSVRLTRSSMHVPFQATAADCTKLYLLRSVHLVTRVVAEHVNDEILFPRQCTSRLRSGGVSGYPALSILRRSSVSKFHGQR